MDAIPADIWKTAQAYFDEPLQHGYCTTIARAIMAERERCATIAEDFSWVLPMFESREVNEATDDAACAVQAGIASAIRIGNRRA